jgi:hypothetical protein
MKAPCATWSCVPVAVLWLGGCLCNADVPTARMDRGSSPDMGKIPDHAVTDLATADSATTDSADLGPFKLDVTCPNGTKPDLSAMPNCKELLERLVKECCASPKPGLNTALSGLVCGPDADAMCEMVLDTQSGFDGACESTKTSPFCT